MRQFETHTVIPNFWLFCFFALIYSPNAICYKIGEKICDQFNNGFILMVSKYYLWLTRHIQVYAPCNVVNNTLLQALTSWPFCVFPGQVDNTKLSVPCEEIACKVNVYQCSVCQGSKVLEFNLLTNETAISPWFSTAHYTPHWYWLFVTMAGKKLPIRCGTEHRRGEFGGGVGGMWAGRDKTLSKDLGHIL